MQSMKLYPNGSMSFDIPGKPVSKGRPRFHHASGRTYTPKTTADAEARIYQTVFSLLQQRRMIRAKGHYPSGPVAIQLHFVFPIKDKRLWGEFHDKRPDIDNCAKLVCDAMQGTRGQTPLLWRDDAQIVSLEAYKSYDKRGMTHLRVWKVR